MTKAFRRIRRLGASATALLLALLLSGCSWLSVPWPPFTTDEAATEAPSTREEPSVTATAEPASGLNSTAEASSESPSETQTESRSETVPESGSEAQSENPPETPSETDPATASESAEETLPESTDETAGPTEETETADPSAETASEETGSSEAPTEESTPPETDPAPERFRVNYYRTPDILREVASDAVLIDAYHLIDAFLAGKTTADLVSPKEEAGRILYVADTLCPLLKAFSDISEDSWSDGKFSWSFYVNKVEFAIIRTEFETRVAEYVEPVLSGGYSETERALLLYYEYTAPASYNYEIISGAFKTRTEAEQHRIHSAYAGIMDHSGVCHDLAGGMTFLFIQAGFNVGRVSVMGGKSEHSWTLIELNGVYTFCDATWDAGGHFSFFGNSVIERMAETGGSYSPEKMDLYDYNAPDHFDIVNPGFRELQEFSYARVKRGISLTLTIDTSVMPHLLIFSSQLPDDVFTMTCP